MIVLHSLAPAPIGGLERVVEGLAWGHRQLGHDVHVLAVVGRHESRHPYVERLQAAGLPVHVVQLPGRAYRREQEQVDRLCRKIQPMVLHSHGYRPDVLHGRIARRNGVATVSTVHGFTGGNLKNRMYQRFQCRALRKFDRVVAVSPPLRDLLRRRRVPGDRVEIVQNAWIGRIELVSRSEARRDLGIPGDGFAVGWVGRLSAEKGPDVLLEAAGFLRDLPVTVSMVGDGPMRRQLEQASRAPGMPTVVMHGAVPSASRLFAAYDMVVMSSRTEGTPIVLLEAMAAGVPVVVPRVGGIPAVVSDREALLVEPADPRALSDGIRSVYEDRVAARRRADAALARLGEHFATDPWLKRYETIYHDVQRERNGR